MEIGDGIEDFACKIESPCLSSSPDSSRIRLFLFSIKPISSGYSDSGLSGAELIGTEFNQVQSSPSKLNHPKTESWFDDALRSSKILQKGDGVGGFGAESGGNGHFEGSSLCGQESLVLETSSSFGSTSSSVSWANLPSIKSHGEVNGHDFHAHYLSISGHIHDFLFRTSFVL